MWIIRLTNHHQLYNRSNYCFQPEKEERIFLVNILHTHATISNLQTPFKRVTQQNGNAVCTDRNTCDAFQIDLISLIFRAHTRDRHLM